MGGTECRYLPERKILQILANIDFCRMYRDGSALAVYHSDAQIGAAASASNCIAQLRSAHALRHDLQLPPGVQN